jgi:hypothetical protein
MSGAPRAVALLKDKTIMYKRATCLGIRRLIIFVVILTLSRLHLAESGFPIPVRRTKFTVTCDRVHSGKSFNNAAIIEESKGEFKYKLVRRYTKDPRVREVFYYAYKSTVLRRRFAQKNGDLSVMVRIDKYSVSNPRSITKGAVLGKSGRSKTLYFTIAAYAELLEWERDQVTEVNAKNDHMPISIGTTENPNSGPWKCTDNALNSSGR